MHSIKVTCPTRVDLAGGTLDIWPLHQVLDNAVTVNIAVNLSASVKVSPSTSGGFSISSKDQNIRVSGSFATVTGSGELPLLSLFLKHYWSDQKIPINIEVSALSPAGAGLGGSSCIAVTLSSALIRFKQVLASEEWSDFDEQRLIQTCMDLESKLIHTPTGCQDYWGALRGGLNIIEFPAGNVNVETTTEGPLLKMREELVLAYCGQSRDSAINNWEIFRSAFNGDKKTIDLLNEIGSISARMAKLVRSNVDLSEIIDCSEADWDVRKKLWPGVETEQTKRLDQVGTEVGARFSRVCGAGGGGVMAFFCDPERRSDLNDALAEAGGEVLFAGVSSEGARSEILEETSEV